ncbi:MAG: VWA domain-containing protein [Planctomycetes bacterium]|nr:VWA domain-containing protein [Planctomycetota bacterium]
MTARLPTPESSLMFTNPFGLLALLALPAILALHLFRRKFQPRVVSALFLWSDESATPISGRRRERLPRSMSLFCELTAAACLALALAGPRGCTSADGVHLVVVVDGSASMSARDAQQTSAVGRAREHIAARIEALSSGSRVTIVESGARPRVLVGPAAFTAEASAGLARWEPSALHHDLHGAIALAQQIAAGGAIVCFTDRLDEGGLPPEVEVQAVGRPGDNFAIVRALRARDFSGDRTQDKITIELASFASVVRSVQVAGVLPQSGDKPILEASAIELAPRERKTMSFSVPRATGTVEIRLGADALAIDDRAFLAPLQQRTVTLRANVSEELGRSLGLSSRERGPIGRWLALVDDVTEAHSDEEAHVLISTSPGGGPTTWTLAFAPLGTERKDFIGPFLADRRHPLLEGTTLEGIVWSVDPTFIPLGAPLVSAGNLPILAEDKLSGGRVYTLALDPERSSLQRSLDWPILLANLVEMRRDELPGASATNLLVGDEITWRASTPSAAPLRLEGPRTEREFPARVVQSLDGFDAPGLYTLKQDGATLAYFGVSFADASESDLTDRNTGERAAAVTASAAAPATSRIAVLLIIAALVALLLDWWVLDSRALVQVSSSAAGTA